MFSPARHIKLIIVVGIGTALVAVMLLSSVNRGGSTAVPGSNQNTDVVRQHYADLYQAAWRQDEGQGNVLMTATLFVPPLIDLLGQDTGKSEAENQLYRAVKDTSSSQIAIFLTIDSVGGPQTDQGIGDSLVLTADGYIPTLASWKPLIFPSRIVNTAAPANSQSGVAAFVANDIIDWSAMTNLRLVSRNLGGIAERNFVWAQPGLLLETE